MNLALIGIPNCGKTTLFNQLTGSNQHVGNFPGVTVDKKTGVLRRQKDITIVDLPGIYSLSPYTSEETVSREYLMSGQTDGIINVIDSTNLERNLYLTLQLLELDIPIVLALNMIDELKSNGQTIDAEQLSAELGVPIVPISAYKNQGVNDLIKVTLEVVRKQSRPKKKIFYTERLQNAVQKIESIIKQTAVSANIPLSFAAMKLIEKDEPLKKQLSLNNEQSAQLDSIIEDLEKYADMDSEAIIADTRYRYLEEVCDRLVTRSHTSSQQIRSVRIDNFLTHPVFAIPVFFVIIALVFWFTFGIAGTFLSDTFSNGIDYLIGLLDGRLSYLQVNPILHSLIIDGACAGIGSVLSFLPTILLLFFFLSLLEDSGYMARVAFIMDRLMLRIGLSGRSFVPMLIGYGCSVPAYMATRTLSSERDRKMTMLLIPFMSCSAKLPIYSMMAMAFFPHHRALVIVSLYVLGLALGIFSEFILNRFLFKGKAVPFVMELPPYRLPSFKSVLLHIWDKAKDFMSRAFTVIFIASIVIWLLQTFNFSFTQVHDNSQSMLAQIGSIISPIFRPMGFGDWRASTALVTGLTAKEAVVSTFSVLTGSADITSLNAMLTQLFTPLSSYAFLVFTLLYMPCIAAVAAYAREMHSMAKAALAMLYQTAFAWVISLLVFHIGSFVIGIGG